MRIAISRIGGFAGLASGVLGCTNSGIAHCVHAVIDTLTQCTDLRHFVQFTGRQQTSQIADKLFQIVLGMGNGIGNRA